MADAAYTPLDMELIVNTPDVRVAEITLAPHTDTPPHEHTHVPEVCYCLEGELCCEIEGEPPSTLRAGQKKTFPAGSHHRLRNESGLPCRFLLVHGGGRFDFIPSRTR